MFSNYIKTQIQLTAMIYVLVFFSIYNTASHPSYFNASCMFVNIGIMIYNCIGLVKELRKN